MPPMLAGLGILSFALAFVAVRLLLSRLGRFALDEPNARSLHERPVPRTGGIAVLRGMATAARLAIHLAAAATLVWYVLSPMHPLELALLILAVAWITNLYNFMDGS